MPFQPHIHSTFLGAKLRWRRFKIAAIDDKDNHGARLIVRILFRESDTHRRVQIGGSSVSTSYLYRERVIPEKLHPSLPLLVKLVRCLLLREFTMPQLGYRIHSRSHSLSIRIFTAK